VDIDITVLVKLQPEHVWLDYIRGIYVPHSHMRKTLAKLENYLDGPNQKGIIPIAIRERVERAKLLTERATYRTDKHKQKQM
jgi:hypothetical protein